MGWIVPRFVWELRAGQFWQVCVGAVGWIAPDLFGNCGMVVLAGLCGSCVLTGLFGKCGLDSSGRFVWELCPRARAHFRCYARCWVGLGGMIKFLSLAHMLDATQDAGFGCGEKTFLAIAHMLDATQDVGLGWGG